MLQEADSLADLHSLVAENLMTKDYASIKAWQKENYHKSMMHFKETKELDEGFKKVSFAYLICLWLNDLLKTDEWYSDSVCQVFMWIRILSFNYCNNSI